MDYRAIERRAGEILRRLGDIDPSALVRTLSISQQQLVEIAKALTLDCRVLILDEPTAALTEREAQTLFGIMRDLAARGISIIYITHRMAEIFDNCDRVTVFRDGQYITTMNVAETTPGAVVSAMVGRVIDDLYPPKLAEDERSDEIILEVRDLTERRRFSGISFQLRKGEILGLAGLIGAGRSEIARGICRLEGEVTGEVLLHGEPLRFAHYGGQHRAAASSTCRRTARATACSSTCRSPPTSRRCASSRSPRMASSSTSAARPNSPRRLGARLNLKYGHIGQPVSALSGGNQQKVAIAKMLVGQPKGHLPRRADARRRCRRQGRDPPHPARPGARPASASSSFRRNCRS